MTTKICPACGNTRLVLLRTLSLKYCPACEKWIPWHLSKGQKPLR